MNDSTQKGYLLPATAPASWESLEDALQEAARMICNVPGELVRPRYQPNPPHRPDPEKNWIALGVRDCPASRVQHGHDSKGQDVVTTYSDLDVLFSFYGPRAFVLAMFLRDGLYIEQNRSALRRAGVSVVQVGEPSPAPELINGHYGQRWDMTVLVTYKTRQRYNVRNLLDAQVTVVSDSAGFSLVTVKE